MGPTVIQTPRLNLRTWMLEDVDSLVAIFDDPEVGRYINGGNPISRWDGEAFVARNMRVQQERGWCRWAIEVAEEPGRLVGFCGPGCTFAPEIELGWTLRRDQWGHGFATEAAREALDYCFSVVGFEQIISGIDPENTRSLAVAQRLGMKHEGVLEYKGLLLMRNVINTPLAQPPQDAEFVRDCEGEEAGGTLNGGQ